MLIVNYQRLLYAEAIGDPKNPMHVYAKEYDEGIKELRQLYPEGAITLKRVGYPKYVDGITGSGKEVRDIPEDIPPLRFSLKANVTHPTRGKEQWAVCLDAPTPMPGGLWDLGKNKTRQITDGMRVDLMTEPDLAFFLVYKCPHVRGGHWKIDDPKAEIKVKGNAKRQALELETAIWQTLSDEAHLRKMAGWVGIEKAESKEPDELRFELQDMLKANDVKAKSDPSINRTTKDFLEALKINDYVRLSSFIRHMMDEGLIAFSKDGRFKVGDKAIAQVPAEHVKEKFPWLCNYLASPNQKEALQELFRDVINKDYLDTITDPKDYRWIAGVMDIEGYYNSKPEQVKDLVYREFVI
jgi:hypothetical protein